MKNGLRQKDKPSYESLVPVLGSKDSLIMDLKLKESSEADKLSKVSFNLKRKAQDLQFEDEDYRKASALQVKSNFQLLQSKNRPNENLSVVPSAIKTSAIKSTNLFEAKIKLHAFEKFVQTKNWNLFELKEDASIAPDRRRCGKRCMTRIQTRHLCLDCFQDMSLRKYCYICKVCWTSHCHYGSGMQISIESLRSVLDDFLTKKKKKIKNKNS